MNRNQSLETPQRVTDCIIRRSPLPWLRSQPNLDLDAFKAAARGMQRRALRHFGPMLLSLFCGGFAFGLGLGWQEDLAKAALQPEGGVHAATSRGGVFLAAYRKPSHVNSSSYEVFDKAVDSVIDWLVSKDVPVIEDPNHPVIRTTDYVVLSTMLAGAREAGASFLLLIEVSRPAIVWIRIELKCYDMSGRALWKAQAGEGRTFSSRGSIPKTIAKLDKKLQSEILNLSRSASAPDHP